MDRLDRELLIRVDERLKTFEVNVKTLHKKLDTSDKRYVKRAEFVPVRLLVYGGNGVVLVGILLMILDKVAK